MDETSKKNFKIINDELKRRGLENDELKEEIAKLTGTISMLEQKVNQIQQLFYTKLGTMVGTGPTT